MKRALLIYAVLDGIYWWQVKPRLRRSLGMT